ncbi:MAG: DnaA N-terminal domain-containing protein, partial [Acetobacteraceae bacterium]
MSVTASCSTAEAEASLDQDAPVQATTPGVGRQWNRVRQRLRSDVGEAEYRAWLRQMTIGPVEGDELTLHLPTRFLRDWVRSHYGERLNAFWRAENPSIRRVDIRVGRGLAQKEPEAQADQPLAVSAGAAAIPALPEARANGVRTAEKMDGRDAFGVMLE